MRRSIPREYLDRLERQEAVEGVQRLSGFSPSKKARYELARHPATEQVVILSSDPSGALRGVEECPEDMIWD